MKESTISTKDKNVEAIFVVGMNGSGTTILSECLGNHPKIYKFPLEIRVLPYYIKKYQKYKKINKEKRKKLARELGKSYPFWMVNGKKPVIVEEDLKDGKFQNIYDSILMHFAKKKNKDKWVEKSPNNIQHIELIARYFPNSYFIHIIRDGRDVAQSFNRRFKKHPYNTIYRWKKIVGIGIKKGRKIDKQRYLEIKYEDFTANPSEKMKEICRFVNVEYHPKMLEVKSWQMAPEDRKGEIIKNKNKYKKYFTEKQIKKMESIAGKFLIEMGYNINFCSGDYEPFKITRKYWELIEIKNLIVDIFKNYKKNNYKVVAKKHLAGIRQKMTNIY